MRIQGFELLRLNIPFRQTFTHSSSSRSHSDTLFVRAHSSCGLEGWGEILARRYVTGENHDDIMDSSGPQLGQALLGREFSSAQSLLNYIETELEENELGMALFGGFELALWNLFAQAHQLDLSNLLGPLRHSATGHCLTVGFETEVARLRHCAIQARISKATVIKVKVGLENDVERLTELNQHLGGKLPIRLDANSDLNLTSARELLLECSALPIQSIEQPFAANSEHLNETLQELFEQTGIPIVADESVCTLEDARRWANTSAYQIFNIRIGKCGGLIGTKMIRDLALGSNIGVVAGTMVGESAVLNQASKILLSRSENLDYVEGLNQYQSFLSVNPANPVRQSTSEFVPFSYAAEPADPLVVSSVSIV